MEFQNSDYPINSARMSPRGVNVQTKGTGETRKIADHEDFHERASAIMCQDSILDSEKSRSVKSPNSKPRALGTNRFFASSIQGTGLSLTIPDSRVTAQPSHRMQGNVIPTPLVRNPCHESSSKANPFNKNIIKRNIIKEISQQTRFKGTSRTNGTLLSFKSGSDLNRFPNFSNCTGSNATKSVLNVSAAPQGQAKIKGASNNNSRDPRAQEHYGHSNGYINTGAKSSSNEVIDLDSPPKQPKRIDQLEDSKGTTAKALMIKKCREASRLPLNENKDNAGSNKSMRSSEEVQEVHIREIFKVEVNEHLCLGKNYEKNGLKGGKFWLQIVSDGTDNEKSRALIFKVTKTSSALLNGLLHPNHNYTKVIIKFDYNTLSKSTLSVSNESGKVILSRCDGDFGGQLEAKLENPSELFDFLRTMHEMFIELRFDILPNLAFSDDMNDLIRKIQLDSIPDLDERHREDSNNFSHESPLPVKRRSTPTGPLSKKSRPDEPPGLNQLFSLSPKLTRRETAKRECVQKESDKKEPTQKESAVREPAQRYSLRSNSSRSRTIDLDSPERPKKPAGPTPLLFEYSTPGGTISVHGDDKRRLGAREFLNDVVIEFYLHYTLNRIEKADDIHLLSTFLYPQLLKCRQDLTGDFKRLDPWVKSHTLFKKNFVLVPIIESYHWYLVIIGRPGSLLLYEPDSTSFKQTPAKRSSRLNPPRVKSGMKSICIDSDPEEKEPTEVKPLTDEKDPIEPWIAILNSMKTGSNNVADVFRDYMVHLAQRDLGLDPKKLSAWLFARPLHPAVPQQKNGYDCGIYLLEFAENFMADPYTYEKLILSSAKSETQTEWCRHDQLVHKRRDISHLMDRLTTQVIHDEPDLPGSDVEILDG